MCAGGAQMTSQSAEAGQEPRKKDTMTVVAGQLENRLVSQMEGMMRVDDE